MALRNSNAYPDVCQHYKLFCLQAIAAIQAKVLRLNSTAISDVTNGKIVNLVSNDVRRFDDAGVLPNLHFPVRMSRLHADSPFSFQAHSQPCGSSIVAATAG